MQYLGIEYQMKHAPKLDPTFIPFGVWRAAYLKGATKPLAIALERDKGRVSVHKTFIHGTPEMAEADYRYVERYVKFLLWSTGGFRVSICGCSELAQRLQKAYTPEGDRHFDYTFVNQLYERNLEILDLPLEACPESNEVAAHRRLHGRLPYRLRRRRFRHEGFCSCGRRDHLLRRSCVAAQAER